MPAGNHNIIVDQGSTFIFFMELQDDSGIAIDLSGFTGEMQVRRSVIDPDLVLSITENGVLGPGVSGEFLDGQGVSGIGGITFNGTSAGIAGFTGGIYIQVDANTMSQLPYGRHHYDIEITSPENTTEKLIQGRFSIVSEVTR